MKNDRLTKQWQQLPRETIRALQAHKLHKYLRDVVLPFSPHYRDLFRKEGLTAESVRSLEDLRCIPFTSKADLTSTPEQPLKFRDFVVTPEARTLSRRPGTIWRALCHGQEAVRLGFEREFRPVFMTSTTGRSADPVAFLYSDHDMRVMASAGRRVMEVCAASPEMRLLNLFPYAPHLAFWFVHYAAIAFGVFSLGTGGGKVMGTDGNLRLIRKLRPDVFIGMPTFLYHVMKQAVEEGVRCEGLRRIVLGGEKVAEGMRRKLTQLATKMGATHLDIVATYGFTEAKMAWAECPCPAGETPSGYHLYPDLGLFEVVDPKTGEPVPDGAGGELVYTPLDSRGSVVLRYRTGDVIDGGLVYEPCPHCGRTAPRLVGKISRVSEVRAMQLDKIKGTLVDFNQLEHVLDDAPNVGAWQLELRKINNDPLELDELVLHVEHAGAVSEERLRRELRNRFAERTEIHPNRIVFHDGDQLRELLGVGTQLKESKIVDNRPARRSEGSGAPAQKPQVAKAVGPVTARE